MKSINTKVVKALGAITAVRGPITTGTVARRAGVSAPTAYMTLMHLVDIGQLEHVGAGRGAHFRHVEPPIVELHESRADLQESELWDRLATLPAIKELRPNVRTILNIAFTEMVNNAVDHSQGTTVGI